MAQTSEPRLWSTSPGPGAQVPTLGTLDTAHRVGGRYADSAVEPLVGVSGSLQGILGMPGGLLYLHVLRCKGAGIVSHVCGPPALAQVPRGCVPTLGALVMPLAVGQWRPAATLPPLLEIGVGMFVG